MTPAAGRALICAHSHPAISKGGAEIAAWSLFEGVQAAGRDAWFMGCVSEPAARLGSAITQPFGARQFLYAAGAFDWFKFANQDASFPRQFGEVLTELRPDLVHFHHYVNFGLESFLHIRRVLPNCKIVLTLHEYQAICNHYGQMITRQRKSLCYGASPRDCNRCFPEFSQADFFLRRAYAMRFFDLVDQFIAPSRFLAERYVKWGLPEARMAVIENVTAEVASAPPAPPPPSKVLRIGFFGQISLLKGIHVLLDAARLLEEAGATGIAFDIHGDHTNQPAEFQSDFLARLETAGSNVRFHGAYDNARVDHLMRGVDAVLVPSIWWENSPVVIQECLRANRPVICSDIGGMAEKVRDGVDGLHFPVGSAAALAGLLRELDADRGRLAALMGSMRRPAPAAATLAAHLRLYDEVCAAPC